MTEQVPAVPFFDELMTQTEDQAKQKAIGLARRDLKREMARKFDHYEGQKDGVLAQVNSMYDALRKNPGGGFDVEHLIELKVRVDQLDLIQNAIAAEYSHLFGEEIPTI